MAHVFYTPDHGFSWTPVVADNKKVKPLYTAWGDTAIFYLCNFSVPFSQYSGIADEAERDTAIIGEMQNRKLGKPTGQGAIVYPHKLYKDPVYADAQDAILNDLMMIPDWKMEAFLQKTVERYKKAMESIDFPQNPKSDNDFDRFNKAIASAKSMQVLITQSMKALTEHHEMILKLINKSGLIGLDELINTI